MKAQDVGATRDAQCCQLRVRRIGCRNSKCFVCLLAGFLGSCMRERIWRSTSSAWLSVCRFSFFSSPSTSCNSSSCASLPGLYDGQDVGVHPSASPQSTTTSPRGNCACWRCARSRVDHKCPLLTLGVGVRHARWRTAQLMARHNHTVTPKHRCRTIAQDRHVTAGADRRPHKHFDHGTVHSAKRFIMRTLGVMLTLCHQSPCAHRAASLGQQVRRTHRCVVAQKRPKKHVAHVALTQTHK